MSKSSLHGTLEFDPGAEVQREGRTEGAQPVCEFRIGLMNERCDVLVVDGREGISRLFDFRVTFNSSSLPASLEPVVVGFPATLSMASHGADVPHIVGGIVAALTEEGVDEDARLT